MSTGRAKGSAIVAAYRLVVARSRRPRRDPWPGALGLVEHSVFEPGEVPVEDAGGDPSVVVVCIGPESFEEVVRTESGLFAEGVGECERRFPLVGVVGADHLGACAGRGDGEQFGADVDDAPEEALLVLEPGLPAGHAVEGLAGKFA